MHHDPDEDRSEEPEDWGTDVPPFGFGEERFPYPDEQRWPLAPYGLLPRERWIWFEQLWSDVCTLRERFRLPVRSRWWEDPLQVEALAAFAAWVHRYDSEEWDDPPGKLALLYDLERLAGLLRDGNEPFFPDRDRLSFTRHLVELGCQPPPFGGRARSEEPPGPAF